MFHFVVLNWLIVGLFVALTTFDLLDTTTVCLCSGLHADASAMRSVLVQVWRNGQVSLKNLSRLISLHFIIIYRELKRPERGAMDKSPLKICHV